MVGPATVSKTFEISIYDGSSAGPDVSRDPDGELVAATFFDRKRLREVAVGGIADVVKVSGIEGVFAQHDGSGLEPRLDQLEDRQVEGEGAVHEQQIDVAADIPQRLERVALANIHQI